MLRRLLGVAVFVLLLALSAFAGAAVAVEDDEEGGPPAPEEEPTLDEVTSGSEVSQDFIPEPYEAPSVLEAMLWPLMGLGVAIIVGVGLFYLVWQPRFAEERREKMKRGRR